MPSLQIRNLPDDVYQALAFRAERAHRSLAQQAIVELRGGAESAGAQRRARVLAEIKRSLAERQASSPVRRPEELVREDRER